MEITRPRRSIPFFLQVTLAVVVVVLLSITAIIFLTSQGSSEQVIERLLIEIHEDGRKRDDRVVCLITVVIETLPEERTPEMIEACEKDLTTTPAQ